jgi:ATP/maltotriose-dependent transcriptional regulator MalT
MYLTKREHDILSLAATGLSSNAIANTLFVSKRTIDFHLANIYDKLGVNNRLQALWAAGLLEPASIHPEGA